MPAADGPTGPRHHNRTAGVRPMQSVEKASRQGGLCAAAATPPMTAGNRDRCVLAACGQLTASQSPGPQKRAPAGLALQNRKARARRGLLPHHGPSCSVAARHSGWSRRPPFPRWRPFFLFLFLFPAFVACRNCLLEGLLPAPSYSTSAPTGFPVSHRWLRRRRRLLTSASSRPPGVCRPLSAPVSCWQIPATSEAQTTTQSGQGRFPPRSADPAQRNGGSDDTPMRAPLPKHCTGASTKMAFHWARRRRNVPLPRNSHGAAHILFCRPTLLSKTVR